MSGKDTEMIETLLDILKGPPMDPKYVAFQKEFGLIMGDRTHDAIVTALKSFGYKSVAEAAKDDVGYTSRKTNEGIYFTIMKGQGIDTKLLCCILVCVDPVAVKNCDINAKWNVQVLRCQP